MLTDQRGPPEMDTATETPAVQLAGAIASLLTGAMGEVEHDHEFVLIKAGGLEFTLTVSENVPDPLAHLKVGDGIDRSVLRSDSDRRCQSEGRDGRGRTCSRVYGHPGQHIAYRDAEVREVWPAESATTTGGDPLGHLKAGDQVEGGYRTLCPGGRPPCNALNRDGQWVCTRSKDHEGQHIATGGDDVLDVWPNRAGTSDPLGHVRVGDDDPTVDVDSDDYCGYDIRGDQCTRAVEHIGQHIGGDGTRVRDTAPQR